MRNDPYVHGLACAMEEKYGIDKRAYQSLVYGMTTPLNEDGEFDIENQTFVASVRPPLMPDGVPTVNIAFIGDEKYYASGLGKWESRTLDVSEKEINGEKVPLSRNNEVFMSFENDEDRHLDDDWRVEEWEKIIENGGEEFPFPPEDDEWAEIIESNEGKFPLDND